MKKIIIFDFLRTLFDPETDRLVPGALEVLVGAAKAGFTLYLVSQREGGERKKRIDSLRIGAYFDRMLFCDEKTSEQFEEFLESIGEVDRKKSFVIGDRVKGEIVCGNACNLQTIWIRNGKFAGELAQTPEEQPTFCVGSITEIIPILERV